MMIIDAHLHIREEDIKNNFLEMMHKNNLYGLVGGTTPIDCDFVASLAQQSQFIIPTYGLHPWFAEQYHISQMQDYLQSCPVIGEIGMDSVWCDADISRQREVFIEQLDIAQRRGCPVILHTKGCEEEIAEIISDYSVPFIVHWYSCERHLEKYLEQNCYFTVGPRVYTRQAVQQVVQAVPMNRLFVESDGLYTIEWITGKKAFPQILPRVLKNIMKYIGDKKGVSENKVQESMQKAMSELIHWPFK